MAERLEKLGFVEINIQNAEMNQLFLPDNLGQLDLSELRTMFNNLLALGKGNKDKGDHFHALLLVDDLTFEKKKKKEVYCLRNAINARYCHLLPTFLEISKKFEFLKSKLLSLSKQKRLKRFILFFPFFFFS